MTASRFDFYERVRVMTIAPTKVAVNGKLGAILGKGEGDDGRWSYGVFIYDNRSVWSFLEDELSTTGEFDQEESFFSGDSMRVSKQGELLE